MGASHDAAFLDRVVEQRKRRRGPVGAAAFQTDELQNLGHAVADGRGGSQRQIHHAKGNTQTPGGLLGYQLSHAGDFKGGALDGLGHHVDTLAPAGFQGFGHNTRAGDAHVDDAFRLPDAVEGTRHEGIVLHRIAEDHELGTAHIAFFRGLTDDLAAEQHGVHVDAGFGGPHVHTGADKIGLGKGFRD